MLPPVVPTPEIVDAEPSSRVAARPHQPSECSRSQASPTGGSDKTDCDGSFGVATSCGGEPVEPLRPRCLLGSWYATALFWRPQVALFVNESTLLPVFTPLAPATGVIDRFADVLAVVLAAHGVPRSFIDAELAEMGDHRLTTTKSRSVVGIMNEFSYLGGVHRRLDDEDDLVSLSVGLARTPCSPLYGRHVSPDRELAALIVGEHG